MIISKHIGRTGNNCYQIAAAIGLARQYGNQWAVDPGRGPGEPWSNIHETFPNLPKGELNGVRYHEHPHGFCRQHGTTYDICHYDFHIIPHLGANVVLSGFFQSWKYFKDVQDEVKKVFELPHVSGYEDHVSIHWRLGDYVQHSASFPPITTEYIRLATEHFKDRKFIIFSDGIDFCKRELATHLPNLNCEFSEGKSEKEDLSTMASCGDHIIANSSFSFWGAYLGHNQDRKIVSPSGHRGNWYGINSGIKKDCTDLIPDSWIQIRFR